MKYLFLVILISYSIFAQQKYFTIDKNKQGGYNIYDSQGELISEYTKQSSDSASLATLNNIFLESLTTKNNKQHVAVINLQEKGIDYSNIIIALATIFSGLGGLWFGYLFTRKSQREQFRNQNKKEWLETYRNEATKLFVLLASPDTEKDSEKRLKIDKEIVERVVKFMLLLDQKKDIHSELFSLMRRKAISNEDKSADFEKISKLMLQIMVNEREEII